MTKKSPTTFSARTDPASLAPSLVLCDLNHAERDMASETASQHRYRSLPRPAVRCLKWKEYTPKTTSLRQVSSLRGGAAESSGRFLTCRPRQQQGQRRKQRWANELGRPRADGRRQPRVPVRDSTAKHGWLSLKIVPGGILILSRNPDMVSCRAHRLQLSAAAGCCPFFWYGNGVDVRWTPQPTYLGLLIIIGFRR